MRPLNGTITITSKYGVRKHPVTGKIKMHYGVDAISSKNNDILATADGQVVQVVNKGSKGGTMCLIRIQHKDYQSAYYHIKSGSALVKKGDWVKAGQKIATMGNTGQVTGVHLHFQIDKGSNKTSIDPTPYLKGTKELAGKVKETGSHYTGEYPKLPIRGYFKKGDKGKEVVKLQKLLNWCNNCKLICDGIIGTKTVTQVDLFEKNNKLSVDGKFGKKCLAKAKKITK